MKEETTALGTYSAQVASQQSPILCKQNEITKMDQSWQLKKAKMHKKKN